MRFKNSVRLSHLPKVTEGSQVANPRNSGGSGCRKVGRWLWRGPANSDGADDGATDQRAACETRQITGVGPRRQTVGFGSAEQPKGSTTWGSDCAAPGPRPPAGVGEGQPSRPRTSRPRATASRSWGTGQSQAVGRSLQRGRAGRAPAKAGCSHFGKTASTAPGLSQNTLETGAPTTQGQERHILAPRLASQQRSSGGPSVGAKPGKKGLSSGRYCSLTRDR